MTSTIKLLVAVGAFIGGVVGGYAWKDLSSGASPNLAGLGAAVRGEPSAISVTNRRPSLPGKAAARL